MRKKAITLATLAAQLFVFRAHAANTKHVYRCSTDTECAAEERASQKTAIQPVVNINTATAAQLALLPDVGVKRAAVIMAYRTEHHGFQNLTEIRQVRGFGDKRTAELLGLITTTGPTTATAKIKRNAWSCHPERKPNGETEYICAPAVVR